MCGIAGFLNDRAHPQETSALRRMALRLEHRGPDGEGYWQDESQGIYITHKRLSIVDLSEAGAQPMISKCQRYVLSYNGEIYNHLAIREEIQSATSTPVQWSGHSDTETILAAFQLWGFSNTLSKLNGMFAIALWDKQENSLFLARDRMGEKPLYFTKMQSTLLFGSELKALKAHPAWNGQIDEKSLADFLRFNTIPAPNSIYKNVYKLKPGHWIKLDRESQSLTKQRAYWNIDEVALSTLNNDNPMPLETSLEDMEQAISKAVGSRMMADVPLGAFLSGGIDSSLVTALMCRHSSLPVKTFSIGFENEAYNEAHYASKVAQHLGTDHTELYVNESNALELVPSLTSFWDEPFADSSQIPTYLVAKLCREHVTVGLSGDGGDELFYGYSRYQQTLDLWKKIEKLPSSVRKIAAYLMSNLGPSNSIIRSAISNAIANYTSINTLRNRLLSISTLVASESIDDLYTEMITMNRQCPLLKRPINSRVTLHDSTNLLSIENKMMLHDQHYYLPDTILTKVDRASMAVSLESRAPLLDHELVEKAWNTPMDLKHRDGKSKWIMRKILERHVPTNLFDRPKMGFGIPLEHWLRGDLRQWAEELLDEKTLTEQGFFNVESVRYLWKQHVENKADFQYQLWPILIFQQWYRDA